MKFLDFLQPTKLKAILIRRFCADLIFLLLIGTNRPGAQVVREKVPTELQLISIFALGGRPGSIEEVEIRERRLDGANALWSDAAGLKAQSKRRAEGDGP
jgi:hypothetical protein